ncbi:FecR domain-containing protein [Stutzerimonas kirkiae]|uniref:Iron dicitrate transport regulator FecR n=1 Tax=Stutzerimonas kirkiae TaxID=2211392 RepID=A0A4Q9QYQ0_9GAMM|nr:FecR domain-containing protein [Stutzerimonas kirkiae]TBU89269.1 iron dicitrate transport regulator FecR [Stutzerimonas kirkiae]TBU99689.1 iron dicitrate transport regulator FecR [Stutzerimonas kirkiae]TBV12415.1 iron dicitrate transport regulator FecR [Stutzerimonas kirkiae]TBV12575.1 iron dicitrate transport regulator FecR [Stutzerimonas kirkiae]
MSEQAIDPRIAGEAADWVIRLQSGPLDDDEQQALEVWSRQSPAHACAWERARQLLQMSERVPSALGHDALQRLQGLGRRRAMQTLALLIAAPASGWLAWQRLPYWSADLHTARGERRTLRLADGSQLVLNTDSAVDVVFDAGQRLLRLRRGEILVTTASDPRRFVVETAQGRVRALGTRFSVRRLDQRSRVEVFEHAVEITPHQGAALRLEGGQQAAFGPLEVKAAEPLADYADAWESGLFVANELRLDQLLEELSRYRSGILRVHPGVAAMRVSGTFPMGNDERALTLLEKTLPLRVSRISRYWVSVQPLE